MLAKGVIRKINTLKFVNNIFNLKNKVLTKNRAKNKIFAIGFNKTGTTSLAKSLSEFDLIIGHQRTAERLMDAVMINEYNSLIEYCKTAEAFQDVPFSLSNTYKILDVNYPNSKFILTVRDSDEQWFNSITKFHSKLWGKDGGIPTEEDLANANYVYKGYPLKSMTYRFGEKLYHKENYMNIYNKHNYEVMEYFKNRPNDLLVINVSIKKDYKRLCKFLNQEPLHDSFSWENKT